MTTLAEGPFMANFALEYAARDVPVFLLRPRGKKPRRGSHGFKDATTDPDVIRAWWDVAGLPDANIGAPTGVVFDVLDIDGPDALDTLCTRAGLNDASVLTLGPVAETSRGWHVYFAPTGTGNRAGFVPGCDWRGAGGYAVLPPSRRADGFEYRWFSNDDARFDLERALPPVPEWLAGLLVRNEGPQNRPLSSSAALAGTGSHAFWGEFTPRKSANYHATALTEEAHAVATTPGGRRNDQLNCSTHTLARLDDLNATTIETVMLAAALDAGLGEHEATATIRSALRARGHG